MTALHARTVQARVRQQYEDLPYPLRRPEDEQQRLLLTGLDDLTLINHYGFAGRKDWTQKPRLLIAGGGTGDALVYLAHQFRSIPCELVYIDLSAASLSVAQQRIRYRGLQDKVMWVQGSLTDVDQYGLGKFDYINCSGVLHHLPDPAAGLRSLRAVLKDDGVMGLMVYGQYGRTGVYHVQDLLRRINADTDDKDVKLARCWAALRSLPPTNWYHRGHELFQPISEASDNEIYDLLLHSQDRAYTIPQLYEFLRGAGLHLVEFTADSRLCFDPTISFRDETLRERVRQLPREEQHAVCEAWWGSVIKHAFWASPRANCIADPRDPEMVPLVSGIADASGLRDSFLATKGTRWIHEFVKPNFKMQLALNVDALTRRFFELLDNRRTMGEMTEIIAREQSLTREHVHQELVELQNMLGKHDLLALRHKSTPPWN